MNIFRSALFAALFACPLFIHGQQDPNEEKGLKAFGSYTGGDFDTVNLMNGNLMLKIPLYAAPQRGNLSLSFSLYTNNNKWHLLNYCPGTGTSCTHEYLTYTPVTHNQFISATNQDSYVGMTPVWDQNLNVVKQTGQIVFNNPTSTDLSTLVAVYDSTQSIHSLGYDSNDWTHLRSNDGGGYFLITGPGTANSFLAAPFNDTLITPSGTQYNWSAQGLPTITDPDGNQIVETLTGFVDTMGRTINTAVTWDSVPNPSCPVLSKSDDPYGNMIYQPVTASYTLNMPGANGSSLPYLYCFTTVYGKTQFFEDTYFEVTENGTDSDDFYEDWGGRPALQSVVLPNQTSWFFIYDGGDPNNQNSVSYVDLLQVRTPLGGKISYTYKTYSSNPDDFTFNRFVTSRTVDAGDGPKKWTYTYSLVDPVYGYTTTVTDPDGNDTVTKFNPISAQGEPAWVETDVKEYQGSSAVATPALLSETQTPTYQSILNPQSPSFAQNARSTDYLALFPLSQTTTNSLGQSVTKTYTYDSGYTDVQPVCGGVNSCGAAGAIQVPFGNKISAVIQTNDGFYSRSFTQYEWQVDASNAYSSANRMNLPYQTTVTDQNNTMISQASWRYDEPGTLQAANIGIQHAAAPAAVRGHPTSAVSTVIAPGSANSFITIRTLWYDTGVLYEQLDGKGQTAKAFSYDPAYAGAYPTSVSNALGQTHVFSYDLNSGEVASHTDPNGQNSKYCYQNDGRLMTALMPDGGGTAWIYDDQAHTITQNILMSGSNGQTCLSKFSGSSSQIMKNFDGMGRVKQTQVLSDPSGTVFTDTTYDNLGRVYTVSNPHRATPLSTDGYTQYSYDALGRKTGQYHFPDGSSLTSKYSGNHVDFSDEAQNHTLRNSDALGRLTQVIEPGHLETDYRYDVLGNLISVNQLGQPGTVPAGFTVPETSKQRSFGYNSLSRLLWSQNPETGVVCYGTGDGTSSGCQSNGYDANGNLLYKTDARGLTTSYTYDTLNRLTSKGRTGGSKDLYTYDGQVGQWGAPSFLGGNQVGRLSFTRSFNPALAGPSCNLSGSKMCDDQYYGYDAMGRMNQLLDATPSEWGLTGYSPNTVYAQYDLAGDLTSLTYPDGRHIAQTFDGAGRLETVADATTGGTATAYISGIGYTPAGAVQSSVLGNGVLQSNLYNSRLQPCHTMATTPILAANVNGGNLLDRESFYSQGSPTNCGNEANNNGNIYAIVDNLNLGWTQGFSYDSLNRLRSAGRSDGGYNHTYNIDSFGNMIVQDNLHGNPAWSIDQGTNRLLLAGTAYGYDLSGNLVQTPTNSYQFDAESRVASVDLGTTALYTYDASGARIRKDIAPFNNQAFTEYTYFNGQPIAEKDQNNKWTDYIYANGSKVAKVVPQLPMLHLHGYRDGNDTSCGAEGSLVGGGAYSLQIADGDRLVFDLQQNLPSYGGLAFIFTDGNGTGPVTDTGGTGQPLYFDGESDGAWHHMVGDLSPYAGETVAYPLVGIHSYMALGTFDMYFANASVVHKDGSMTPVFTGQTASVSGFTGTSCGGQNLASGTDLTAANDPAVDTTYYLDDHLGTTQMELSAGGWPMWQGQFTPFGQELPDGNTAMHYKFTGKERDTESGLDYFGARYYGSNMGRFMSPDPLLNSGRPSNPQTWNRYTYGLNDPLRNTDPTGLYTCSGNKSQCSGVSDALKAAQGALGNLKKGSAEYKALSSAIGAYGKAGVDNGVHVGFGATAGAGSTTVGVLADANGNKMTTADNPTGQNINVTIDPSKNGSVNQEAITVGHEGSHVADGTALVGALPMSLSSSDAVLGGPLNMTSYQTEMKAYGVSSSIGQGLGLGMLSVGNDNVIWNSSWGAVDVQTLRTQGIQHELADPKGLYNVTPDNQGHKLIQ